MAGIAGIRTGSHESLQRMLARIKHRGPQQTWINRGEHICLGCCELRALPTAHAVARGKAAVLDGHLYNQRKPGETDAGLIIDLYEKLGSRFPEKLDGDFACALAGAGELVLARDPVGLKPLYYGYRDGELCFASEAKALMEVTNDIKEFPPSHIYTTKVGFQKYTRTTEELPDFTTQKEAGESLVKLLRQAVQRRMEDGAPGGILLSGGLDSSIIACLASQLRPDIKAFTVAMDRGEDIQFARDVARYLGIEHHIYLYTESEIVEVLPQVIYHLESFEEDNVRGAIANFFASRLASRYTDCVLSGEGADEFLGGYQDELKLAKDEAEMARLVNLFIDVAYNTGLQRLDRMMAAHSLDCRTAFLDQRVTDFCLKIPLEWRVHGVERIGKWILREAFSGLLPEHILWQTKRPFASGAGSSQIMGGIAERFIPDEDFMTHRHTEESLRLRSAEELYYYRTFKEKFPLPALPNLVAKWSPFKPDLRE